jgi:hypothetical protein
MKQGTEGMATSNKKEWEVTGSFKVVISMETQGDAIAAVLQSLLEHDVDVEDIRAYENHN